MKTFDEVFNEIKSNVSVGKNGKVKKTFSRADFDTLLKAMVNDVEYTTTYCGTKNGELVKKEVQPVKMFRESLKRVLTNFGVDSNDAEKIVSEYKFTNVDGWYELMSEIIYRYMEADKKFDFPTREDFKGSISMKNVDEAVGTYSSIKKKGETGPVDTFKIETKSHKILEKKSKAPNWLKKKFK